MISVFCDFVKAIFAAPISALDDWVAPVTKAESTADTFDRRSGVVELPQADSNPHKTTVTMIRPDNDSIKSPKTQNAAPLERSAYFLIPILATSRTYLLSRQSNLRNECRVRYHIISRSIELVPLCEPGSMVTRVRSVKSPSHGRGRSRGASHEIAAPSSSRRNSSRPSSRWARRVYRSPFDAAGAHAFGLQARRRSRKPARQNRSHR